MGRGEYHYLSIKGQDDLGRLALLEVSGFHRWHKVGRERKFQTHKMHSGECICAAPGILFLRPHFASFGRGREGPELGILILRKEAAPNASHSLIPLE